MFNLSRLPKIRLAPFGAVFIVIGILIYLMGFGLALPRRLLFGESFVEFNQALVWYSGIPLMIGFILILFDILYFLPKKKGQHLLSYQNVNNPLITVVLTAYNDELSIAEAVEDFKNNPLVKRVIVISNNSVDKTIEVAESAGAIVFNEPRQGYGACVFRALSEGVKYSDTDMTLLCEGDRTFRAYDIDKLLAYIPHVDLVNGTRTVEQLRSHDTQLTVFMYYGNLFVAKLLELKHLGKVTLTDVGTTYKLCRNQSLKKLLPKLDPNINLEFNPYLLDIALENEFTVVECPISFHARVGVSKGGNVDNWIAAKLGMKMMKGILFGWKAND